MSDRIEVDFLGVGTKKSGDTITVRYFVVSVQRIHVVDGSFVDTGDQIVEHLQTHYGTTICKSQRRTRVNEISH